MDASELHARRLNAKELLTPMKGDNFIFPVTDRTVKVCGGDQRLRTSTLNWDRPDRGEEQDNLRGESENAQNKSFTHVHLQYISTPGDFIYRHHVEPRVKLNVPTEESSPILRR